MLSHNESFISLTQQVTNRSANESIKGYSYQFDRSVIEILECSDPNAEFIIEGVEDIDVLQADLTTFVQCKYYEGTDYNHSEIKHAIIAMLKNFNTLTTAEKACVRYKLYGHFKSGQGKLEPDFSLDVLKKSFLTFKKDGVTHNVYNDLGLTDVQLKLFQKSLDIDLCARGYDDQRTYLTNILLVQQIPSCTTINDAQLFFYPSAATAIQHLAIQSNKENRRITKSSFIRQISKKDIVFNLWLQASFDSDKYAKIIKKNHFLVNGTKRPKAARLFAIEVPLTFDLGELSEVLTKLATSFSHKELVRTPEKDRYCPYALLRGISEDDLIKVKKRLHSEGLLFDDGYPFRGAEFSPRQLAKDPTKGNLYQLKLLSSETEIMDVFSFIEGTPKKIYDFYIASRLSDGCIHIEGSYEPISVEDPFFITKIF